MRPRPIRDISLLPDEIGQDSFLDTIANLVGVLIILVVMVGANAKSAPVSSNACAEQKSQIAETQQAVQQNEQTDENIRAEYSDLQRQIATEESLLEVKSVERRQILTVLTQLNNELEEHEATLDQAKRDSLARNNQRQILQQRLNDLEEHSAAIENHVAQVQAIDHYPTPIAKTVFRDDVHFRLKGGKLAFIPMDELLHLMRAEWELKAEKLANALRVIEAVGPSNGFRLQYELVARRVMQQSSVGPVSGRSIELDHFVVLPLSETMGEPLVDALQSGSGFFARIQRLKPEQHTISVWVYPDSYQEFNDLKRWLYDRGFQTAAWPQSEGAQISGGPNGFRATAQ